MAMKTSQDRILTTHVGSLPRPPELKELLVCIGPVAVRDREPLEHDLANLRDALAQVQVVEGFVTAASPGLVPVFQTNRHYPSHEAYVEAIAAAMQEEYEAIVNAGFVLQLDCPDLAMARHTSFQELG